MKILFNNKVITSDNLKIQIFLGYLFSNKTELWHLEEYCRRQFQYAVDIIDNYRDYDQIVDLNEGVSTENTFYIKLKSEGVLSYFLKVKIINDQVLSENNISSTLFCWKNLLLDRIRRHYDFQEISLIEYQDKYLKLENDYKLMSWFEFCQFSNQSSYLNHNVTFQNKYKEDIWVSLRHAHLILLKRGCKRWDYNNEIDYFYYQSFRFVSFDELLIKEMSEYSCKQLCNCYNLYSDSTNNKNIPVNKQTNSFRSNHRRFQFSIGWRTVYRIRSILDLLI